MSEDLFQPLKGGPETVGPGVLPPERLDPAFDPADPVLGAGMSLEPAFVRASRGALDHGLEEIDQAFAVVAHAGRELGGRGS